MKRITGKVLVGLFAVGIVLFGGSDSFAGSGSAEQPGGSPPYGVAVQSDAQGVKLTGVVTIEFYNIEPVAEGYLADARIVARLAKGSVMKTVQGLATDLPYSHASSMQQAIQEVMSPVILDAFFGGDQSLTVTVKSFDDLGEADFGNLLAGGSSTVVADIVLAVK